MPKGVSREFDEGGTLKERRKITQSDVKTIIEQVLGGKESVFFVQVGSNDGVTLDPLHEMVVTRPHWRGIFVEPVKYLYQRLTENYGRARRFVFENVAIGKSSGKRPFYYISEDAHSRSSFELPNWCHALGSFDRSHILKHLDGRLEPYIIEEEMECISLQELLDRNSVETINLFHIDVEGFDLEVLSQLDLCRYRPCIILCEHKHLSIAEKGEMETLLSKAGYSLSATGADTLAVRSA